MQKSKTSKLLIAALFTAALLVLSSAAMAASLSEDFEGTFPPSGWTVINNDGGSYTWVQYSGYAHGGTYSAGCHYESNESDDWMITPQLTSVGANDVLSFWYRIRSSTYPESLEVRLSITTDDISSFTDVIFAGTLTSLSYVEQKVNLGAYVGEDVYIAFVYKSQDMFYLYVDDVSVYEPAAHDYAVNQFIDLPGSFEADVAYDIKAEVENKGGDESACDVKFFVDGSEQATLDVPLLAGEKDTVSFSWTPSLKSSVVSKVSDFELEIQSFLTDDADPTNDSVMTTATVYPQGYTTESFEDATFPPEGWARNSTDFSRSSGSAHSGSYKAYARAQNAWLFTPQLAVGAGDVLKYWYRAESASHPTSFYVRLSTSASQEDTTGYTTILADHQNVSSTTYEEGTIDLSPYADKGQVYIAFHRYYCDVDYYYLFLDDVTIPPIYVPPGDMATISIDDLPDFVQTSSSTTIKATVQNLGGDVASAGVPVKLRIEGPESYVYTDEEATTVDLATDETEQIIFTPDWVAPEVLCNYTVTIWTELTGDAVSDNDTLADVVTVYRAGGLAESFTGETFPPAGWTVYSFDGGDQWSRYTSYYHSEPACARIYYDLPNNDWLITPRLSAQDGDKLKFWWRVQSSSYEETVFVRVSTSEDVSDTSAYSIIHAVISSSTDWSLETVDLSAYDGQYIYIAWTYDNYNNYGFAIDDVTGPYFPTQIAVSPDDIYEESFPDSFFDVYMYIGNVGGSQLDYTIELETSVGWLSVDPTSGSALSGEEDTVTLSFNTTGLDGHYYNTVYVISNSGQKQDEDTVSVPVHLWCRAIPGMAVSPDSFAVDVPADGTEDEEMYVTNTGGGQLDYEIATEEWGKAKAVYSGEPATRPVGYGSESKWDNKEPEKDQRDYRHSIPPGKGMGGPDAFGYRWIDSDEPGGPTFNWVEINSIGTQVSPTDDGNVGPYPIGFTFNYYGIDFTEFRIASNGFATLTSTSGTLSNTTIPSTGEPNNLFALMWDDLRPASGGGTGDIYYHSDGSKLVIEWDHVMRYGCDTCLYTMEIILYSNGKIIYQYMEMGGDRQDESTIGIENGDGTDGLQVVYNAYYVHDNMAIRFSAAPSWIVYDPQSGAVPIGEEDTVDVTFDATGILSGDFYGALIVTGNDPDNPADTVPAHMTVLAPDMTLSPDSVVTSGTEGAVHHETVNIGNAGPGDLDWSIDEDVDWLSAAPSSGSVASGDPATAVDLTVDCTSLYAGDYVGELTINNNDPDLYPSVTYLVYLHVGPDPSIDVDPDSFYVEVFAGAYKDSTLRITNDGAGHLVFDIEIEEGGLKQSLSEDFEGTWPPTGWSLIQTHTGTGQPTPSYWTQSDYYVHAGTYSAGLWWDYGHQDEWLITPPVGIAGTCSLTFWTYGHQGTTHGDHYWVKVSTDGGSNWNEEFDLAAFSPPDTGWNEFQFPYTINLSGYSGQTIMIAFHAEDPPDNDGLWYVWFVDDIELTCYGGGWLTVNPEEGVVDPSTYTDLNVHFDATNVLGGEKFGNIVINHNVPEPKGQTLVPVHMVVMGPEYSVDPENLVIDALEGQYTDAHLYIGNLGGLAPLTFELSDDVAWLEEIPSSGSVAIDDQEDVIVRVDGNQLIPGDYYTEIYVHTNDYDETYDTVGVSVHVGPDPVIRVNPEAFLVEMFPGTVKDSILWIVNEGDGTLAWEITIEDVTPLSSSDWSDNQQEIYDILKANEQRVESILAEQAILSGSGSNQAAAGALKRMTADEIMAARQNNAGAGLSGKQDYIKACVLDSWGGSDFNWVFWDYMNANWSLYGGDEIVVDYSVLDFDGITYTDLVNSEANILIVSNAWRALDPPNNWVFTTDEITAITQYCNEGCGLIVTSGTLDSYNAGANPANFATLVGFDPTETYLWPGYYQGGFYFTDYDFIDPAHPILANMTEPYMCPDPDANATTPASGDWRLAVTTAEIIAADLANYYGAITVDESMGSRRIFWSHIAENGYHWTPGHDDYQLVYNSIIWGGGAGAEWLLVSPESGQTSAHDSTGVDVTFDATDLEGGTWFANIIIDHNAPDKGQTIVPVRLSLLGANFSMTPESLVIDMLEGEIVDEHLFISNFGGEGDLLFSMTDPSDWLTEDPDAGAVTPDGTEDVVVRVDGTSMIAGHYYTEITITTNDFDNTEVTVPVHVNCGPDPDIDIAASFSAGVIPGCEYAVPLRMDNLGGGHLGFDISIGSNPPVLGGSNNIRQALEDLRKAGDANPDMDMSEAYRIVGAEKSSVPFTGGGSSGLLIQFSDDKDAEILLVDDDGGTPGGTYSDIEDRYINALNANGFVYDYYVVDWTDPLSDGPDLTTMQAYTMVIWFTGETWGYYGADVLTANDEANLAAYLDGGGNLFLSAQDYLYASYSSAGSFSPGQFPYDYLHLASVSQDAINDPYSVVGVTGSVAEGMAFDCLRCYDLNPDVPLWTDYLVLQAKAVNVFETSGNGTAVQYDAGGFKTLFTTTEFAGLVDGSPNTRAEFMAAVVEWMLGGGCPFTVTPESGIMDPESYDYLTLTFDGSAFTECAEDILTCYLTISSNDPDEPVVGVEVNMWPGRGDVTAPACLIELADVVYLVNFVLKGGPAPDPLCMGDCDPTHDGMVDAADIIYLLQYLYGGGLPPTATPEILQPTIIKQPLQKAPVPMQMENK